MVPLATAGTGDPGAASWSVFYTLPFVAMLLSIALLPLAVPRLWESNRNKLLVALGWGVPVAIFLVVKFGSHGVDYLLHSLEEYVAFITLLTALFVISGGVYLRGSLSGTPLTNSVFMAIGAVLASFVGTTGASMLLIRPLLRANAPRERKAHIVIFFIFIVANAGGMLTPLGDPPLFLGFLRGVPFLWTFGLWAQWAMVNALLLVIFNVMDQVILAREEKERPGSQLEAVQATKEKLGIHGSLNFVYLLGVIGLLLFLGTAGLTLLPGRSLRVLVGVIGLLALAALSWSTTPRQFRNFNQFTWHPIIEVAVLFLGIFLTMIPALHLLEARGADLGVTSPWQFFWAAGALSSFLDNAPTYLTFGSLAVGVVNQMHPGAALTADHLGALLQYPEGVKFLTAVSCGAVFMGANTYIGNGPNFMVKSIAEESGIKMPSFFGYMVWSGTILIPIFVGVTLVFFR